MRKSILIFLFVGFSSVLFAQDSLQTKSTQNSKVREAGLLIPNLSDLSQIGLTYRFGTEKGVWRINGLYLGGDSSTEWPNPDTEAKDKSFGYKIDIGREQRATLVEKLEFRYGVGFLIRHNISKSTSILESDNNTTYNTYEYKYNRISMGPTFIIGFNYLIKESILLGAELNPSFTYTNNRRSSKDTNSETGLLNESDDLKESFTFGLNNNSVLLSVAYRF